MTFAVNIAQSGSNNQTMRNRIINGAMTIDQRNNGAAVTGQQYLVDRWRSWFDPGTYSFQQVTDAPAGFTNSLRVTKTNTTQSSYGFIAQYIEGFNCADLAFGTANAQPVTVSFWVKSSVTGAFTVAIGNSAENRWYGANYSISAANTWEYKTVTIPGDTTGTWLTNNGIGVQLSFNFGQAASAQAAGVWTTSFNARAATGSTNLGTTNGATWQVTGVQLEEGTAASPFENRLIGTELALCQRYYYRMSNTSDAGSVPFGLGFTRASNAIRPFINFPVQMRVRPTGVETSGVASHYSVYYAGDAIAVCNAVPDFDIASRETALLGAAVSGTPFPAGGVTYFRSNSTSAYLGFSAEL